MAGSKNRVAALVSVKPKYAAALLDGSKVVEFRKSKFGKQVDLLVIYASTPVRRVVGVLTVKGVEEAQPAQLWRQYHRVGGIKEADFFEYYLGRTKGVAIHIGERFVLSEPQVLEDLGCGRPPQAYQYMSSEVAEGLIASCLM